MNVNQRKNNKKRGFKGKIITIIIIAIVVIVVGTIMGVPLNLNDHKYVITVTDKERVYTSSKKDSSSKYLIFGDGDNGKSLVFENTDTLLRLKLNSSNIQGKLKVGHTYDITVVGLRIPILSMYENVIKVIEIQQ